MQFQPRARLMSPQLRPQVITLYKNLLYMGREYPKGYQYFRDRLKAVFAKNRGVTDPEQIRLLIGRGQFVIKELEALYMLRKYRTLKHRYYEEEPVPPPPPQQQPPTPSS